MVWVWRVRDYPSQRSRHLLCHANKIITIETKFSNWFRFPSRAHPIVGLRLNKGSGQRHCWTRPKKGKIQTGVQISILTAQNVPFLPDLCPINVLIFQSLSQRMFCMLFHGFVIILCVSRGSKSCLFELKHSIRLSDSAQCLGPLCLWQCSLYTLVPPGKNSTIYWVREIIGDNDDIILKLLSISFIITTPSFFCILIEGECAWKCVRLDQILGTAFFNVS